MLIQNVWGQQVQGRLILQWTIHCDARAIAVEVGSDREFTQGRKMFVLPVTTNCALSVGGGFWYYRVGAFVGEVNRGTIEWSGIYGPTAVVNPRKPIPSSPLTLKFKQIQPVYSGIQFHTEEITKYYAIIEQSKGDLKASLKSVHYVLDDNKGFVTATNMSDQLKYTVRISTFEKNVDKFPTTEIVETTEGKLFTNQVSMKQQNLGLHQDRAQFAAAQAILQQEQEGRPIKFNSHAEYTRYMGLKAMTTGKKQTL
jgi:hypothetical protein